MRAWANLYPWDADGDPPTPDRIAGRGVAVATLAAAYHAVRAVTPFHPGHRIVTSDAAAYYRAEPSRWRGTALQHRGGYRFPVNLSGDGGRSAALRLRNASRATCSEVRDSAESRLTPRIRSMSRSRS